MRKLLIVQHSQAMVEYLTNTLQDEWEIHAAMDSYPVIDMLQYLKPDGIVLDLNLQPKDGLSVLDEAKPFLPPVIVATTDIINDYIIGEAERLGVGCLVRTPFLSAYIKDCLTELSDAYTEQPKDIVWHLHTLGFDPKLTGYRCLAAAILLFSIDPNQLMKEVYPAVADICDLNDGRCVERVIRTAINNAWETRDIAIWKKYFATGKRPSNKEFIARLAEIL